MSGYDYAADMAEQSLLTKKRNKKKLNDLLDKYGSKEDIEQNADLKDSFEYMFADGDELIDEVLEERLKESKKLKSSSKHQNSTDKPNQKTQDSSTSVIDTLLQTPEAIGELAADIQIAKQYYDKMNATGKKLVNTYGPGQAADIDNYYHSLLQCELAKISPTSRKNGIALGYAKEYIMDYPKKRILKKQEHNDIMKDSRKDLQNNLYGSNLGQDDPNISCRELLDDRRTKNMKKANLW